MLTKQIKKATPQKMTGLKQKNGVEKKGAKNIKKKAEPKVQTKAVAKKPVAKNVKAQTKKGKAFVKMPQVEDDSEEESDEEEEMEAAPAEVTNVAKLFEGEDDDDDDEEEEEDDEEEEGEEEEEAKMDGDEEEEDDDAEEEDEEEDEDEEEEEEEEEAEEDSDEEGAEAAEVPAKRKKQQQAVKAKKPKVDPAAEKANPKGGRDARELDRTIFVKNLATTVTQDKLMDFFDNLDSVSMPSKPDGAHKGFAYLLFNDVESAETALKEKQGAELEEQALFLDKPRPRFEKQKKEVVKGVRGTSKSLFVRNFPFDLTDEKLKEEFGATTATIHKDKFTGKPKGFAFVDFDTPEAAVEAYDKMQGHCIGDREIYVDFAVEKREGGGYQGGRGKFRGGGGRGGGFQGGRGNFQGGRGGGFQGGRGGRGGGFQGGRGGGFQGGRGNFGGGGGGRGKFSRGGGGRGGRGRGGQ